jgi:hypothetical protein
MKIKEPLIAIIRNVDTISQARLGHACAYELGCFNALTKTNGA